VTTNNTDAERAAGSTQDRKTFFVEIEKQTLASYYHPLAIYLTTTKTLAISI
jgi:hypothetical protein